MSDFAKEKQTIKYVNASKEQLNNFLTEIEIKRAKDRMGGKNPFNPATALKQLKEGSNKIPSCAALKDNKCSIYTARPAICRLYGVAEGLDCPFGCQPKKKISKQEAYAIVREIEAL